MRGTKLGIAAAGTALVVLGGGAAWGAPPPHDPPGNNGTIKVDGQPFDDAPDNEPHPGCTVQLDFYGFDAGELFADVTFDAIAPTAGGTVLADRVAIGEDSHAGGGSEAGLDASKTYDLAPALGGIAPAKQGWHVKVTVHADGSQGADVKHKVFWLDGCAGTLPGADVPPAEEGAPTPLPEVPLPPAPPAPEQQQVASTEAAPSTASVLGEMEVRDATIRPAAASSEVLVAPVAHRSALPATGTDAAVAELGVVLVAGGGAALALRRRRLRGLTAV